MAERFTEIVAEEKMVVGAIQSLIEYQIKCTLEIPRTKYSWVTLLLGIHRSKGTTFLSIDRVSGFETILSRFPDREVSVGFRDAVGVPCMFNTQVVACRARDILSQLPREIHRVQRRQYFRMEASLGTEMTFHVGDSEAVEKAMVKNCSAGGVACFPERETRLEAGDFLSRLEIRIPQKDGVIQFDIPKGVVRRVEEGSSYGEKRLCALEFLEIPIETRNQMVAYIFKDQRVAIQRLRR
jgi:c-di-GMP-binding flagellar brake protein YcgR